ncbi:hypothetical protein JN12_03084 [Geobacter argillaceus]|uniref:Uncharacterized protein n=1 Tax=Geobacter argillaceus TaxID=345631 RepID=A0A562VHD0_9BACT|nr:hypothetical protein JN12_03084 [Geobacter argillaceus]
MRYFLNVLFILMLVVTPALATPGEVPLTVDIGTATSSAGIVVTSGIPFPIGAVSDPTTLRILDSNNNPVAAQFTSIVNWPDGSAKSVLTSFEPAVSGNAYATYKLRYTNTGSITNPTPTNAISVSQMAGQIIVNTGVAKFYLNKDHFTVFDQVSVDVNNNGTFVNQMQTAGDLIFKDSQSGNTFKSSLYTAANGYTISIVDQGPIKTTIKAAGKARGVGSTVTINGDRDLLSYEVWMTFYANSGKVDFKNVWIDNASTAPVVFYTNKFTLSGYHVELPLVSKLRTYAFGSDSSTTYQGTVAGEKYLLQDAVKVFNATSVGGNIYTFNYSGVGSATGNPTTSKVNGSIVPDNTTVGRALGWMDAADGTSGVSAAIKYFWEKYPAKLSINDQGVLRVSLQPEESTNTYLVTRPGDAMSDDFMIDFHRGTDVSASRVKGNIFVTTPILRAPAQWYTDSGVFGPLAPPNSLTTKWENSVSAQYECSANLLGCQKAPRLWGRDDFGDFQLGINTKPDGTQYVNRGMNHYEDAHGWLLEFVRKADEPNARKYFDFAVPYAINRYNQGTMHIPNPNDQFAPTSAGMIHWHGDDAQIETGHIVPGGLTELYYLTGDPRAFEVGKEQGDWIAKALQNGHFRVAPEVTGDLLGPEEYERSQAWPLYTAIRAYEMTGLQKYWDAATVLMQYTVNWWKMPNQSILVFDAKECYADITTGSNITTNFVSEINGQPETTTHIQPGMLITNNEGMDGQNGIPTGTTVVSVSPTQVVMSNAATQTLTRHDITFRQKLNTNLSPGSQALYYEPVDWTRGNGYFLSTLKTDNSLLTVNSPLQYALAQDQSASWAWANHIPVGWMAAYLNSDVIYYYENLKKFGGSYTTSVDHGHGPASVSVDADTIREMLIQTTNILVNHNWASTTYASMFPWLNNTGYNHWVYSAAPERGTAASDGDTQMPFVLNYISNFTQSELSNSSLSNRWVTQWPTLQAKFRDIAYSSYHQIYEGAYFSPFTGYNGAPPLWNGANAVSLMFNTSADTTPPVVTGFIVPPTSNSLTVALAPYSFSATDNLGVTGYMITESSTPPLSTASGWSANPPTSYDVTTKGSHTLYPWAKDYAGNVSTVFGSPGTVIVTDTTPAVISEGFPTGVIAAGYSSTTLHFKTNEAATCKWNTIGGLDYTNPANTIMTNTGGTYHYRTVTGMAEGLTYSNFIRCVDTNGNVNTYDYVLTWSIGTSVADTTPPVVTIFTIPTTSTSLTIPVSSFAATDNIGVAGYIITESSTPPPPNMPGWVTSLPTTYTSLSSGSHTLYPWAKDVAGNVSPVFGSPKTIVINLSLDTSAPTINLTSPGNNSTVSAITTISANATDNVGVTRVDYYVNGILRAAINALPYNFSWNTTTESNGSYMLFAKAYDAANNVGQSSPITVTVNNPVPDTIAPTITAFTIPVTSASLTIAISSFTATDNLGVTGYLITERSSAPTAGTAGWSATAPTSFTFSGDGIKTAYAWAKDAAGNVSTSQSASVTIDSTPPTVTIAPVTSPTTQTSQTLTGTVTDNLQISSVMVKVGTSAPLVATIVGTTWSCAVSNLALGSNLITVTARDNAGNTVTTNPVTITRVNTGSTPDERAITIADSIHLFRLVLGFEKPTPEQMIRFDVAPIDMTTNPPQSKPDGKLDIDDVIVMLRRAVGFSW